MPMQIPVKLKNIFKILLDEFKNKPECCFVNIIGECHQSLHRQNGQSHQQWTILRIQLAKPCAQICADHSLQWKQNSANQCGPKNWMQKHVKHLVDGKNAGQRDAKLKWCLIWIWIVFNLAKNGLENSGKIRTV